MSLTDAVRLFLGMEADDVSRLVPPNMRGDLTFPSGKELHTVLQMKATQHQKRDTLQEYLGANSNDVASLLAKDAREVLARGRAYKIICLRTRFLFAAYTPTTASAMGITLQ